MAERILVQRATEFLKKSGETIQVVSRTGEEKLFPRFAAERDAYEQQVKTLADPQSDAYKREIALVREMVSSLLNDKVKLQRAHFEHFPQDILKKPDTQSIDSDHNVPHLITVAALGASDATRRAITQTSDGQIDPGVLRKTQIKAAIVGILHDARRPGDVFSSFPPAVMLHGWEAAWKIGPLLNALSVDPSIKNNRQDIQDMKQALWHHDIDLVDFAFWKRRSARTRSSDLQTIKLVDRATLGRLFESKHMLIRMIAGYLAAKRMRDYPSNAKEEVDPSYMNTIIKIAGTVDILTRQKIRILQQNGTATAENVSKVTVEDVSKATLDTLEELGFFSPQEAQEKDSLHRDRREPILSAA